MQHFNTRVYRWAAWAVKWAGGQVVGRSRNFGRKTALYSPLKVPNCVGSSTFWRVLPTIYLSIVGTLFGQVEESTISTPFLVKKGSRIPFPILVKKRARISTFFGSKNWYGESRKVRPRLREYIAKIRAAVSALEDKQTP